MTRESPTEPTKEELIELVAAQVARIERLVAENAALKARLAELERRLGLIAPQMRRNGAWSGLGKCAEARRFSPNMQRASLGKGWGFSAHQTGHMRCVPVIK
jgi:hypothetical protein